MGHASSHLLSEPQTLDWKAYTRSEWRSSRVKELDELGGLGRPTIARGKSFQSRLDFLGVQVLGQADEIHELFEKYKAGKFHQLHQRGEGEVVAQWRVKVHAARRRLILVVWGVIRFRSTMKHRSRLRRVDTFGYLIPLILGPDTSKFIAEQLKCIQARQELVLATAEEAAEAAAAAAVAAVGPPSLTIPNSPRVGSPVSMKNPVVASGATIWLDPPGSPSSTERPASILTAAPPALPPSRGGSGVGPPTSRGSMPGIATRARGSASQSGNYVSAGEAGDSPTPNGQASGNGVSSSRNSSDGGSDGPGRLPPRLPSNSGAAGPAPQGASEVPSMPKIPFSRSNQRRAALLGRTARWSTSGTPEDSATSVVGPSPAEFRTPSDGMLTTTLRGRASRWSTAGTGSDSEQAVPGGKSRFNNPGSLLMGSYNAPGLPSPKVASSADRPQWNALHHTARVWSQGKPLSALSAENFQAPTKESSTPKAGQTGRLKLPELGPGSQGANSMTAAPIPTPPDVSMMADGLAKIKTDMPAKVADFRARLLQSSLDGGPLARSRRSSVVSEYAANQGPQPDSPAHQDSTGSNGELWPGGRFLTGAGATGALAPGVAAPAPARAAGALPHGAGQSLDSSMDDLVAAAGSHMGMNLTRRLGTAAAKLHELGFPDAVSSPTNSATDSPDRAVGPRSLHRVLTRSDSCRGDMSAADMMLAMYMNRCNTSWTSQQQWLVPSVVSVTEQASWETAPAARDDFSTVMKHVRKGKVAFWFVVGEDSLPSSSKPIPGRGVQYHDIWTSDPYDFIMGCRPGLLHDQHDRIVKGYSYQSRALGQLAMKVQEAGGREALSNTHVILSINDDQQEDVTRELWDHKFYGFERKNVIVIAQQKRPGYRYDPASQRFVIASDLPTPWESNGTGIAAMQMNWCPDAFILNSDGLVEGIFGTTAELLSQRGVEWMMCHRARDLVTMEGCLDFKLLAQGEWLRNSQGATMMTQVLLSDKMSTARYLDSLVINRLKAGNTEVRMAELSSHALDQAVEKTKSMNGGKVAVGIQRYLFSVPHLRTHLVNNKDFRPKLRLREGLLFLKYDISDITSTPGASLAAVQVAEQPPLLMSDKDLDHLLSAAQQQDRKQKLLNLLDSLRPKTVSVAAMSSLSARAQMPAPSGNCTVVFVERGLTSLPAVRMAVTMSRPGKDIVNLCTFVAEAAHIDAAKVALHQILERLGKSPVAINVDVLVRGGRSLLDAMQAYVTLWKADLVVVPSTCLARTEPQALLGSVALAILKRMECPVLMLSSKAAPAANAMYDRNMLRMMLIVEGWTMPLVEYVCTKIQPRKGDKLILAQVHSSRISTHQQMSNMRHYMAGVRNLMEAKHHDMSNPPLLLDGSYSQEVDKAVREYRINVLAVQQPPGTKAIPKHLVSLLCSSVAGVLVMKGKQQR